MIYLDETLDANSAVNYGLVTKIMSGDKELNHQCENIVNLSSEVSSVHQSSNDSLLTHFDLNIRSFWKNNSDSMSSSICDDAPTNP